MWRKKHPNGIDVHSDTCITCIKELQFLDVCIQLFWPEHFLRSFFLSEIHLTAVSFTVHLPWRQKWHQIERLFIWDTFLLVKFCIRYTIIRYLLLPIHMIHGKNFSVWFVFIIVAALVCSCLFPTWPKFVWRASLCVVYRCHFAGVLIFFSCLLRQLCTFSSV